MMVGPIRPSPSVLAIGGALARAISCQKMTCCIRFAPRPPYCLGQETPAHPPANNLRCHVLRYSKRDSSDSSRLSAQSVGTLAVSQERNSSRNCISSDVKFRSTPTPYGTPLRDDPAYRCCRRSQFQPKRPWPSPICRPQFFLQHFPSCSLGQCLAEFDRAWTFVVRQIRAAELHEFRFRRGASWF